MTREELVERVRGLRQEVGRLNADPWSPAVERSLWLADMYFHMALWHLGEVEEVTPELRASGGGGA